MIFIFCNIQSDPDTAGGHWGYLVGGGSLYMLQLSANFMHFPLSNVMKIDIYNEKHVDVPQKPILPWNS